MGDWAGEGRAYDNIGNAYGGVADFKVQLTPKIISPLTKSTSFPNYFSEKIISIDKIPAFLQGFKVVISSPTTEQNGIWVGLLVTSSKELGSKNSRDFDWASSAVKT